MLLGLDWTIQLALAVIDEKSAVALGSKSRGTVTLRDSYYLFPRCSTDTPANSSGPAYYDVKYTSSTTTCTCTAYNTYNKRSVSSARSSDAVTVARPPSAAGVRPRARRKLP